MKVNVWGSVLGEQGYDSHCRGLIQGLVDAGVDVVAECPLVELWDRNPHLNDKLRTVLRKKPDKRAITLAVVQPPVWKYKLSDRPVQFFGMFVFEGDKVPKDWCGIAMDERVTGIIVPSKHTYDAVLATEPRLKDKTFIVSHGVDLSLFKPGKPIENFSALVNEEKCTFVWNKGWANGANDRSGFDILLKAYSEEFTKDDPVRMLVHVNKAYCPPGWDFQNEVRKTGLELGTMQQVVYLQNQFEFNKIPNIYQLGHYVLSCSKAEAFNLPVLEGMACGLVPICPDNGGEVDFVNDLNGIVFPAQTVIPAFGGFLYNGISWKKAEVTDVRKALRKALVEWQSKDVYNAKKEKALEVVKGLTWKNTAEKIMGLLK